MAQADDAISEVRRLYALALAKVKTTPGQLAGAALEVLTFGLSDGGMGDAQKAELKDLQDEGPRVDNWAGKLRGYADAGQRPDGSPYTWGEWQALGRDFASDFATQASEAWNADLFVANAGAALATGEQVASGVVSAAEAVGGALLKPWVWWAVGIGAVLVIAAPYIAPLLRRAKP